MYGLAVNWTIDFGQILTLVGVVTAIIASLYVSQTRLKYIEARQERLDEALTGVVDRFDKRFGEHETIARNMAADVQRLIGLTDPQLQAALLARHRS